MQKLAGWLGEVLISDREAEVASSQAISESGENINATTAAGSYPLDSDTLSEILSAIKVAEPDHLDGLIV